VRVVTGDLHLGHLRQMRQHTSRRTTQDLIEIHVGNVQLWRDNTTSIIRADLEYQTTWTSLGPHAGDSIHSVVHRDSTSRTKLSISARVRRSVTARRTPESSGVIALLKSTPAR
jgi:hypothetical protein